MTPSDKIATSSGSCSSGTWRRGRPRRCTGPAGPPTRTATPTPDGGRAGRGGGAGLRRAVRSGPRPGADHARGRRRDRRDGERLAAVQAGAGAAGLAVHTVGGRHRCAARGRVCRRPGAARVPLLGFLDAASASGPPAPATVAALTAGQAGGGAAGARRRARSPTWTLTGPSCGGRLPAGRRGGAGDRGGARRAAGLRAPPRARAWRGSRTRCGRSTSTPGCVTATRATRSGT